MKHCKNALNSVAPLAGAWIETRTRIANPHADASRPSRARGLKLTRELTYNTGLWSRPSRARGLKHHPCRTIISNYDVAPLAGAWIETTKSGVVRQFARVAPLAGAWIETLAVYRFACFA